MCSQPLVGTNEYTYVLKNGRTRVYPHTYTCAHAGCMKVRRGMADVDQLVTRVVLGVLERDGVRILSGDPAVGAHAQDRIAALEAKLAPADFTGTTLADAWHTADVETRKRRALPPVLGHGVGLCR